MNKNSTETDIDKIVISEADDDSAWEKPISVKRERTFPIIFSGIEEITIEKDVLDGTLVFRGTKVPISSLFDNLSSSLTLDDFLKNFPSVTKEQAIKVLKQFKSALDRPKKAA